MQELDIGDLQLERQGDSLQEQLFHAIRDKIVSGLWPKSSKLPSTRKLSSHLSISRNTVSGTYDNLVSEGYIESRPSSGYFVAVELPDSYLPTASEQSNKTKLLPLEDLNKPFATGIPDLQQFPYAKWNKLLQRHNHRPNIMGSSDIQGVASLRDALAHYLSSSRSVRCNAHNIIITSGAQQALTIATMATLQPKQTVMMESPGYAQMRKVLSLLNYQQKLIPVLPQHGLEMGSILNHQADALYVTPSNQYPMGTSLNTEKRLELIQWAKRNDAWIIEDDYDSEFQFAHRPFTSMQGLAAQLGIDNHVIYIGSLSKVMFNGLRIGYMVVPDQIVDQCLMIKDALSGDSPAHTQYALADFIQEGHLLRHIRKMRRLYSAKRQAMVEHITHCLGSDVTIISQAAGLHITLQWRHGITEQQWAQQASKAGIRLRTMDYYETKDSPKRDWQGAVLGFGNISIEQIPATIKLLAQAFYRGE